MLLKHSLFHFLLFLYFKPEVPLERFGQGALNFSDRSQLNFCLNTRQGSQIKCPPEQTGDINTCNHGSGRRDDRV